MEWKKHPELRGKHAFLSPSKHTWLRKSDDELTDSYYASFATDIGTVTHAFAADCIEQRRELFDEDIRNLEFELRRNRIPLGAFDVRFIFPTLMNYVNDGIEYGMDPEVPLWYSDKCFGTVDAIQFRRNKLRIHDLKTGVTPAKIDQLMIYAGLFFLDYGAKPDKVKVELRIYQANDILICEPIVDEVREVMNQIVHGDAVVQRLTK